MSEVMILTGLADTRWAWRPVAATLSRHRVLVADRMWHPDFPTLDVELAHISHHVCRSRFDSPVLIAYSLAAVLAEAYARTAPVSALILVEPSVTGWAVEPRGPLASSAARSAFTAGRQLGRFLDGSGLARWAGPQLWQGRVNRLARRTPSPAITAAARVAYRHGEVAAAAIAERLAYGEWAAELARMRRRTRPPAVPVVVLTAIGNGLPTDVERRRIRRNSAFAGTFPEGDHRVVPHCGRLIQLDQPDAIAAALAEVAPHGRLPA